MISKNNYFYSCIQLYRVDCIMNCMNCEMVPYRVLDFILNLGVNGSDRLN